MGDIEGASQDDVLLVFVKCVGAESENWTIDRLPVLGLILEYLPADVALEITDLFFQD